MRNGLPILFPEEEVGDKALLGDDGSDIVLLDRANDSVVSLSDLLMFIGVANLDENPTREGNGVVVPAAIFGPLVVVLGQRCWSTTVALGLWLWWVLFSRWSLLVLELRPGREVRFLSLSVTKFKEEEEELLDSFLLIGIEMISDWNAEDILRIDGHRTSVDLCEETGNLAAADTNESWIPCVVVAECLDGDKPREEAGVFADGEEGAEDLINDVVAPGRFLSTDCARLGMAIIDAAVPNPVLLETGDGCLFPPALTFPLPPTIPVVPVPAPVPIPVVDEYLDPTTSLVRSFLMLGTMEEWGAEEALVFSKGTNGLLTISSVDFIWLQ